MELNPFGCTIRVKKANRAGAEGCLRGGSCVSSLSHSGCPLISMRDGGGGDSPRIFRLGLQFIIRSGANAPISTPSKLFPEFSEVLYKKR